MAFRAVWLITVSSDSPPDEVLRAFEQLGAQSSTEKVAVIGHVAHDGGLIAAVDLATSSFTRADGGLPVGDRERLYVEITVGYPHVPPVVHLDHHRWDGYPHVLQGSRLCLYLDPAREWNPAAGIEGFLHRLWDWFDDAVANRFDAATALYHPVGGVFHRTPGTPTVVVVDPLVMPDTGFHVSQILFTSRSDHRLDVSLSHSDPREAIPGLLVVLSDGLPQGGGRFISDLAVVIRGQDSRNQRRRFLAEALRASRHLKHDQHLYVLIAVPNTRIGAEARHHLIGWRLPRSSVAQAVALAKSRHRSDDPHPASEPEVQWTFVDDNRAAVTTRRDEASPVSWFRGKAIELWGCGALGSWIAEELARCGASAVTLRDAGYVTRGLLVRQNYTELDVGRRKVDALADRLRALCDVEVIPTYGHAQGAFAQAISADLVIDCTVNTAVAVELNERQRDGRLSCPVVQVATDNHTASLGLLTVTAGDSEPTTDQLDDLLREVAARDPALGPFRTFWDRDNHPPLTPTLGCSVPTFYGSAADALAISSTAISLAAHALSRRLAGGYLFAAAHSAFEVPARTEVAFTANSR